MFAGFWRRLGAYVVDILPIMAVVLLVAFLYFDGDKVYAARFADRTDTAAQVEYSLYRITIRVLTFLIWIVYALLAEASPLQGTIGKWVFGIKVVDRNGERISFLRSITRSSTKILSYGGLCVGFIWIALNHQKRGWHDITAGTFVVHREVQPIDVQMECDAIESDAELTDEMEHVEDYTRG